MSQNFNYEQSIWGDRTATLRPSDPAAFRLRQALQTLAGLPAGARVLEVGCGAGQFIRAVANARPDYQCFGSDISAAAIARARAASSSVRFVHHDPRQLPYDNSFFDAALIFDVLEHVEDPRAFLGEVARVLKPGGRVSAFVPCEGDILSFWNWLEHLGLKQNLTRRFAGHIQFFSRRELRRLLAAVGLTASPWRYSEHFLGQIIGVLAFWAMARATPRGEGQVNNETYFTQKPPGPTGQRLRAIVNAAIYLESRLLSRLPSPNVHLVAYKK